MITWEGKIQGAEAKKLVTLTEKGWKKPTGTISLGLRPKGKYFLGHKEGQRIPVRSSKNNKGKKHIAHWKRNWYTYD